MIKQRKAAKCGKVYDYYKEICSPEASQESYETAYIGCSRRTKWRDLADFMD